MTEAELLENLQAFEPYTYCSADSGVEPGYPFSVPNVSGLRVGSEPLTTNCSAFVEGLILPVAAESVVGLEWGLYRHKQMMVQNGEELFSPVDALIETDLATQVYLDDPLPPWTMYQGWRRRKPKPRGHAFIVVRHDPVTDKVLVLESNYVWKLNGVGWRGIGNLRDVGAEIPEDWVNRTDWTRDRLFRLYPYRAGATLQLTT